MTLPLPSLWASDSVSVMLSESIYLLELLVIAVVSIALILITVSIARSRNRISKLVTDYREEMTQERAVLRLTMESVKEKEQQISYMAHLLQTHLEHRDKPDMDGMTDTKKKAGEPVEPEVFVEVLDEEVGGQQHTPPVSEKVVEPPVEEIDPRQLAADGSVKRAHFGPDQFIAQMTSFQQQVYQRIQHSVVQANQYLSDTLVAIRVETEAVEVQRSKIQDCIFVIKANIRTRDTQRMNAKDSQLIQQLERVDARLQALKASQVEIEQCYQKMRLEVEKYTVEIASEGAATESASVA